jgi:site-specific DNA recombinase
MLAANRRQGMGWAVWVMPDRNSSWAVLGGVSRWREEATLTVSKAGGVLESWLGSASAEIRSCDRIAASGLRFAFYGRTSTVEFQDPVTSRGWQLEAAEGVVGGRGVIVAEFFDVGCSRRVSWRDRPEASALLAEVTSRDRRFDAVVVGEFERAFVADQFEELVVLFKEHGVQVWLPEAGGAVEPGSSMHRALMMVLGAQSQREVLRARHRTMAAMRSQVAEQGRFLGGRPPYGYMLVDAGPHPNRVHASWGRRLQKLAPDPATARHVRWIFAQRLAGRSAASLARELTERGVLSPSGTDPVRNRHRTPLEWSLRTVIEILRNPRYTGRQVWNRTSTDRSQRSTETGRFGQVRNTAGQWVISETVVHPALVSEVDFVAAQSICTPRTGPDGSTRSYRLSGLIQCARCGRRLDSHWVHGRAGYRCRHGHRSSRTHRAGKPGSLYRREDHLIAEIATQLSHRGHRLGESADDVEAFLRACGAIIVCDAAQVTVQLRRQGKRLVTSQEPGIPVRVRRRGRRTMSPYSVRRKPHGLIPL